MTAFAREGEVGFHSMLLSWRLGTTSGPVEGKDKVIKTRQALS
jgi:hypothetical protein